MGLDQAAVSKVSQALRDLGFRVEDKEIQVEGERVDLLARKGRDLYAIEVKAQAPFRRREFLGAVASAILQLRYLKKKRSWLPLLAVWVDKARPNAAPEFIRYLERHAGELNWLIMDLSGWVKWRIKGEEGESLKPVLAEPVDPRSGPGKSNPFSPRYQWMLKLLLLPGIDKKYWKGSDRQPSNISELASIANVSQSHAWNLVALLEHRGYLRRDGGRFRFPGVLRLLEDWSAALRLRPDKAIKARPIYPLRSQDEVISRIIKKAAVLGRRRSGDAGPLRVVVGGHHGCRLLGLGRSNVLSIRLYVDQPAWAALDSLDLVPAEPGSPLVEIVQPRAAESVFRGSVPVGGVHVADALQCSLDLRQSAARGEEQSDFIEEKVLEPHFRRQGWL